MERRQRRVRDGNCVAVDGCLNYGLIWLWHCAFHGGVMFTFILFLQTFLQQMLLTISDWVKIQGEENRITLKIYYWRGKKNCFAGLSKSSNQALCGMRDDCQLGVKKSSLCRMNLFWLTSVFVICVTALTNGY